MAKNETSSWAYIAIVAIVAIIAIIVMLNGGQKEQITVEELNDEALTGELYRSGGDTIRSYGDREAQIDDETSQYYYDNSR